MKGKSLDRKTRLKLGLLGITFFGSLFFFLIPYICLHIDKIRNLPQPISYPLNLIGIPISILGVMLSLWCVELFFKVGKGTPAPIAPPTRLVVTGPYRYTRNPMVIGLFTILVGLGILLKSLSLLIFLFCLILPFGIIFIKCYEERDLERRFKEEYIAYKERTPFLFPHLDYLVRCSGLLILAFLKGFGKGILISHAFFTFWRKTEEYFAREDRFEREDSFWIPPWAGFFGQVQRLLILVVPTVIITGYIAVLWFEKIPVIFFPILTHIIDYVVERRFLGNRLDMWIKSMED